MPDNINSVGVIATETAIKAKTWLNTLKQKYPKARVLAKSCPELASAIEENNPDLDTIVKDYLTDLEDYEHLILGCTHYPLVTDIIKKNLDSTAIINPSQLTVLSIKQCIDNVKQGRGTVNYHFTKLYPHTIPFIENILKQPVNNYEEVIL